ncbi:hypothetical protein SK128_008318, partial [Halocaridina rubra]
MKLFLSILILWVGVASTFGCSTLTEDSESVVDCSNATDISEVVAYMEELAASWSVFHNRFRILNNPNITSLVDGLFGEVQFLTVEISRCPALSDVGDFLGASSNTLTNLIFTETSYPYIPALDAPGLLNLEVSGTNVLVQRSAFSKMKNIEVAVLNSVVIEPFAFFDLENLRSLVIPFPSSNFMNLTAGTLNFNSQHLQVVDIVNGAFFFIEYGSIE